MNDFDGDGKIDKIEIREEKFDQDGQLESKQVSINLSSQKEALNGTFKTETGSITAYQGTNPDEIIIDFSNRSSRDAAELSYLVYRWSKQQQKFCLKASVDGIPANQLQDEITPRQMEVTWYSQCVSLGNDPSEHALGPRESSSLALNELSSIEKNTPIPEYLASELGNIVNISNVTQINDAGYFQEQQDFLIPALIILESVHSRFPKRSVATLNLADTHWKLGNKSKACALYREYLGGIGDKKKAPRRAYQRAKCSA